MTYSNGQLHITFIKGEGTRAILFQINQCKGFLTADYWNA